VVFFLNTVYYQLLQKLRLIRVSCVQLVLQVFAGFHRRIFVRAVEALDRDIVVTVYKECNRSSDLLTLHFVVWYHHTVRLQYQSPS